MDIKALNLLTNDLFSKLDLKDGKQDKLIDNSVWNDFADIAGGKKINNYINKERAVVSIKSYIKRSDENTLMSMAKFAGMDLDLSLYNSISTAKTSVNTNNNSKKSAQKPVESKIEIDPESSFSDKTKNLNNKTFIHSTTLLQTAQNSLGLYEISPAEYRYLKKHNPSELQNTQYKVIGSHGSITDAWCAHTVSYLATESGMDIGKHKASVQSFVNWAGDDYKRITTKNMNKNNYLEERENRANEIKKQLPDMHEGDFVVWKNNSSNKGTYVIVLDDGTVEKNSSSHIGILEDVDLENGVITVIEGNANESVVGDSGERVLIKTSSQAKNGSQCIGGHEEVNKRDGLIRKQYTIEELATFGYSGYIDNSSRTIRV